MIVEQTRQGVQSNSIHAMLAQFVDNHLRPREILLRRIARLGDYARNTSCHGSTHADMTVLHDHAPRLIQPHLLDGHQIHVRRRFLLPDHVAGVHVKFPRATFAHEGGNEIGYGLFVGGGTDGQSDVGGDGIVDEAEDAGSQWDFTVVDELHEDVGFLEVEVQYFGGAVRFGDLSRPADLIPMSRHTLLPATHLQQRSVSLLAPFLLNAILLERHVERQTMAIAFGIGEDAVAVE
mmetsp:Transcript_2328/g.4617  ORF Transcript_2328/g.4617 Transcript_2328/m.4617 type:complete len:235 (+) Transcript_2328:483-1187(+)